MLAYLTTPDEVPPFIWSTCHCPRAPRGWPRPRTAPGAVLGPRQQCPEAQAPCRLLLREPDGDVRIGARSEQLPGPLQHALIHEERLSLEFT
jgi:hypothetical protein